MAEIKICTDRNGGQAGIPRYPRYGAVIQETAWGIGHTRELVLYVGPETIRIWPADRERIRQLGERLIELSESL